jgi:hypothetical protein
MRSSRPRLARTLPVDDLLRVKFTMCEVFDGPTFYENMTEGS